MTVIELIAKLEALGPDAHGFTVRFYSDDTDLLYDVEGVEPDAGEVELLLTGVIQ